jgi:[protein-PII] uridylyltransferase
VTGISVVAVGGYGRGELSPHSDIDLLFVIHPKTTVNKATLRGLLYPLWDAGFQVGHSVRTPKEAIDFAARDLDAATSLLSARMVAGGREPFEEMMDRRGRWITKDDRKITRAILDATADRHRRADRAGWALAPDLKEDVGGLRDLHTVGWLSVVAGEPAFSKELADAGALLLAVREALHAEVSRKSDRIRIDLQPAIAERLGLEGDDAADLMMARVHSAARTIEHESSVATETVAERVLGGPKRSGSMQVLGGGTRIEDGVLVLDRDSEDVASGVRLLAHKAVTGRRIAPGTLTRLKKVFDRAPIDSWDEATRSAFFDLLAAPGAAAALELLDHVGAWGVLMPEWMGIRGRAQYDPYHRYTVDGHSFIAVGNVSKTIASDPMAAAAAEEAGRLEPLVLAALLHDIGKGSTEDHTIAGERLARSVGARVGLDAESTEEVAALVRWHLLLPDTATRRDLDDGAVIQQVADTTASPRRLRLLYILAAADGRATGPEAWSDWKQTLVRELYRKALVALETGETPARSDVSARARQVEAFEPALAGRVESVLGTLPPSYLESTSVPDMVDEIRLLLDPPETGQVRCRIDEGAEAGHAAITVCVPDRPGTLARTAGVLSLHRVSVLRAHAYSTTTGLALERFIVLPPSPAPWDMLRADLEAVYSGRLALDARLEKKAVDYRPVGGVGPVEVRVLKEASAHSTVVEVRTRDALGLLYAITAALSDLDVDIHVAKIDTLGERVVDVFYVRTAWGSKLDDGQADEVERSIQHRVGRLLG